MVKTILLTSVQNQNGQFLRKLMLTFVCMLSSIATFAYDFESDGIYYDVVSLSDLTCGVSQGDKEYEGEMKIPSSVTYNGKELKVVSVIKKAFYNCKNLTSVELPNTITSIGIFAFDDCENLQTVNIPSAVSEIGGSAFYGCSSLQHITLPDNLTQIEGACFKGCSSLEEIEFPDGVTSIEAGAFSGCSKIKKLVFPNGITSIGESAFWGCSDVSYVEIPNTLNKVGQNVFAHCDSITELIVGSAAGLQTAIPAQYETLVFSKDYADSYFATYPTTGYFSPAVSKLFSTNTRLKRIVCNLDNPLEVKGSYISNSQFMDVEVLVPTSALATYQADEIWQKFWNLKGGAENYSTGIATPTVTTTDKPDAIYDLNGRRLSKPQKGLNIINGKKVLVK